MGLKMMTDDEIFADPQQWLLDVIGKGGYREFKNQWPQISSQTKIEVVTTNKKRWGVADCRYSVELDTLFITR